MTTGDRLQDAVAAWRESLVMLSGRNRLLNYRPTKSSTLEFTRASTDEVVALVEGGHGVPVVGTVPAAAPVTGPVDTLIVSEDLESRALDVVEEYDFSAFSEHLFVNKTQREVDRALKNLSSTASREYLDRGLSVLYFALGALHWTEFNGDARVSPLVFLPVELKSDGPRQPPRVYSSEGDMVVNPALDIRVREYGVTLPDQATIESLMADGGMAAVESAIAALALPEGWHVEPMCVLSAFMFAKEAMFRDLEAHEETVLASPVVQALAGASDAARERTLFAPDDVDDIDRSSPPEVAPLILDADSSQRVAVAAAMAGKSFVLDGPPGTGKSQTIANIIAALVASGKKVLFVSEKAVALDVVRDRLSGRGLGPLLFELHSHKATRAEVAASLGDALSERPSIVERNTAATLARAKKLRLELSEYAAAMNEVRGPIGWTLHDVVGRLSSLPDSADMPTVAIVVPEFSGERWDDLQDVIREAAGSWTHLLQGERHLWYGIRSVEGLVFDIGEAARTRDALIDVLNDVAPRRADVSLDGLDQWRAVEDLATHMRAARPEWVTPSWLVEATDADLERAGQLIPQCRATIAEDEELRRLVGAEWRALGDAPPFPEVGQEATSVFGDLEGTPTADVQTTADTLVQGVRELESASTKATAVAASMGLSSPRYIGDIGATVSVVRALDEIEGLRPAWLTGEGFGELTAALDALARAQADEAAAQARALASFAPTIIDIDVATIHARWEETPLWRRALFGPSGDDRRMVGAHTSLKPRAAAADLGAAVTWATARDEVILRSAAVEPLLGYVPRDDDAWNRARRVVDQCRSLREASVTIDSGALGGTRANDYAWRAIMRDAAEVDAHLAAAAPLAAQADYIDESREIVDAIARVNGAVAAVTAAVNAARPYSDGGSRSLSTARDIRARVVASAARAGEVEREGRSLASALPGLWGELTMPLVETLAERLEWTAEMRRRTAQADRAASLDVYAEVAWAPELVTAGDQWDIAAARLRERFEHDRIGEPLQDEAESGVLLASLREHLDDAEQMIRASRAALQLRERGLGPAMDAQLERAGGADTVEQTLRAVVLRAWTEAVIRGDSRLSNSFAHTSRDAVAEQFRELDREIVDHAAAAVLASAVSRRPSTPSGQTALVLAEASKKRRHIPVRDLIARATDVIQAVHPCFMMSPLAVSQFLPPDIQFDVVIFDEASQVPPGDAINCLYRARAVIAAGDQKQLPPTAFFASMQASDDDESGDEDLANDYESLLDLMKGSGAFTSISLLWHYRSKHEHLIAYSNNAFYDDRLITFPGALADVPDAGVRFHRVDGVYRRSQGQDNPKEAEYVAGRVIHHLEARPGKSVGVVAMSAAQRDAISNALVLRRADRPELESHFNESRLDGIFVKSLEEVQGDERDVIIMSIGYGPDSTGTVYKNFGPINKKGGERRLNVAITRAKELTEVVASMGAGDIGDVASAGGRHLRRYLDYAERGPAALELELGDEGRGTDSPFEDAVISAIRSWGYDVQPQVGVSGFRIDIGVKHPNRPGVFMLGVECDGAMYHSAKSARDRDRLRHDILVGLGWTLHHIWGTDWYRHRNREEERLRRLLESLEADPSVGRFSGSSAPRVPVTVEVEDQEFDAYARPAWVLDYVPAKPRRPRNLDWTDAANARHLVAFVEEVTRAEGPLHLETMKARLREYSTLERVNKNADRTLRAAIELAAVTFDGEFLRVRRSSVKSVREAGGRALNHISPEEFTVAVLSALAAQVGASREDLALGVARAFGWRRTGRDISERVNATVDLAIREGAIEDGPVLRWTAVADH